MIMKNALWALLATAAPLCAGDVERSAADADKALAQVAIDVKARVQDPRLALLRMYYDQLAVLQQRETELRSKAADAQAQSDKDFGFMPSADLKSEAEQDQAKAYLAIAASTAQDIGEVKAKIERLEQALQAPPPAPKPAAKKKRKTR